MTTYFVQAFIYLCAAVVAVPLAKRLGLGSVLGYLIAGVMIGPVIGLVGPETVTIQHFAEFGVVMMLFLVGLELEPSMLWSMRHRLLGLGGLQLGGTTLLIMAVGLLFGLDWRLALAVGLILSLSSTAIVLQTFNEKGLGKTEGGRSAFSVLLFQDIAVIPMLALIPLLALPELLTHGAGAAHGAEHHAAPNLLDTLPQWAYALVVLGAVSAVVFGGHYLSRPLFRYVAASRLPEVFTATALMLVIGIAALMSFVGLSPALGTFLAGVVLANSEFRHELESNIEPFKGLLLGLFFITVGAGINFGVLAQDFFLVMGLTVGIIALKAAVLFALAKIFRIKGSDGWLITLSLAQAGEFGFVLLSFSAQNSVLPADYIQVLSLVVALSMLLTPGLFILFDKLVLPRYQDAATERDPDAIEEKGKVIIAGVGRFGQIVNRLLTANGIPTTVLDHEAGQVENLRKVRIKSYFGDVTRPELLHTAGIDEAELLVVSIDDRERAVALVHHVKKHYPQVPILARAYDRGHAYELQDAGADFIVKETYHSALCLGVEALKRMGFHPFRAEQLKAAFEHTEKQSRPALYESWKETAAGTRISSNYLELFMQLEQALSEAMKVDRSDRHSRSERGWTPPPKGYAERIAKVEGQPSGNKRED